MKPKRVRRERTKGWRMPQGAVYVGHPTRFGNPFDWRQCGRRKAVALFRRLVGGRMSCVEMHRRFGGLVATIALCSAEMWIRQHLADLRGKDLCCWCPLDAPCHADVLLKLANEEAE